MAKGDLIADRLRELLHYDAITGVFVWAVNARRTDRTGEVAGCADARGYWNIRVDGRQYRGHRLAWLYAHGCWPLGHIDHINGDRSDNRLENLRDVTALINNQNRRSAQASSTTGLLGSIPTRRGQYKAVIKVNGRVKHIGTFSTPEAAHAAYVEAKRLLHEGNTL